MVPGAKGAPEREVVPEREVLTAVLVRQQHTRAVQFFRGPIPLRVIAAAGALPGRALLVLLAILYRIDITGRPKVSLPNGVMREFGFDRFTKLRALAELERAGLIGVQRRKGQSTVIELTRSKRSTDAA